ILLAAAFSLPCASYTQMIEAPVRPNATRGVVEAVLENGDMKPARFAQVYAIPAGAAADIKKTIGSISAAVDALRTAAVGQPQAASQIAETQCVMAVAKVKPILEGLKTSRNGAAPPSVVTVDADEMGEF